MFDEKNTRVLITSTSHEPIQTKTKTIPAHEAPFKKDFKRSFVVISWNVVELILFFIVALI
jgi:predicted metalloenzyme YecM